MATTSIWRVRGPVRGVLNYIENEEKTTEPSDDVVIYKEPDTIEKLIAYAGREEATNKRQYVTGINCSPDCAPAEMNAVKRKFGKTDGVIAYHGYQSFAQGEVTPDQAHQIGIRLANELWGDRYQVVVATHLDKQSHLHNHFLVNTVSFRDGKKYHRTKEDYRRMRLVSDRLCREENLSVIHKGVDKSVHYSEWSAEKEGKPTYRAMIRADIDRAVAVSVTEDEFYDYLEEIGYELKFYSEKGKLLERPSLRPKGADRFFRFDRLGEDYYLEDILARVVTNTRRKQPFPEEEQKKFQQYRKENPAKTEEKGLARDYYLYAYKLKVVRLFPSAVQVVTQSMREDIIKFEKLDQDVRFLGKYHIKTYGELKEKREEAKEKLQTFSEERNQLRTDLKRYLRHDDEEAVEKTKDKIRSLTEEITKLRHEIKICNRIEKRSIESAERKNETEDRIQGSSEKESKSPVTTEKSEVLPQER